MVPSPQHIVHHCDDQNPSVHHCAPVHGVWFHRRGEREEGKYEHRAQEAQRPDVDCHTEPAERPSVRWERFPSDTLEEQAGNRDDVRGHHCADSQGHDGEKRRCGADVDERQEDCHCQRDHHGVQGDVPARVYLVLLVLPNLEKEGRTYISEEIGERKAAITRERP